MASKYYYYQKIYTVKNKPQGYPNPNFKVNFNGNDINNLGIEPYIPREEALRLINKYKNNYKQCGSVDCAVGKFQSYNAVNFGKTVQIKSPITCNINKLNFRMITSGVIILFNIFLAYFVNRLLYTMCNKSLS